MATTITRRSTRRAVDDEKEHPPLQVQAIQQRFIDGGQPPRARRPVPVATQTPTETTRANHQNIAHQHGGRGRMKRPLELVDGNHDHAPSKRNRIAVEIISRSIPSPILPPRPIAARPQQPTLYQQQQQQHPHPHPHQPLPLPATVATPQQHLQQRPQQQPQQQQQQQQQQHYHHHQHQQPHQQQQQQTNPAPLPPPPSTSTTTTTTTTEPQPAPGLARGAATATADPPAPSKTASTKQAPVQPATITSRTNHRDKVLNGIKHELDRLQPSAGDAGQAGEESGRRKLRSQEATRFKSELSAYFPDYDEVIGNDAKEEHVLNFDTPIVVVDSQPSAAPHQQHLPHPVRTLPPRHAAAASSHAGSTHAPFHPHRPPTALTDHYPVKLYGDDLFSNLFGSERIVPAPLPPAPGGPAADDEEPADPLSDAFYAPAHRRAERLEKSIRNTERGRAQHERDQVVRLLNDLQGHDWLRTMGVNGVTESRKKTFEPARDYFVKGCQGILDKFRHWIQEEKRMKLERERAAAERAAEEDDSDASDDSEEEEEDSSEVESTDEEEADDDEEMMDVDATDDDGDVSDGDPPDASDVDASIAKQLHDESLARAAGNLSTGSKRLRGMPPSALPELYVPPREFVSFFEKRHQRDASLGKHRRAGRSVMAWGHGIPELEDEIFDLPEEYRDDEFMKVRERKKRLDRRGKRR